MRDNPARPVPGIASDPHTFRYDIYTRLADPNSRKIYGTEHVIWPKQANGDGVCANTVTRMGLRTSPCWILRALHLSGLFLIF